MRLINTWRYRYIRLIGAIRQLLYWLEEERKENRIFRLSRFTLADIVERLTQGGFYNNVYSMVYRRQLLSYRKLIDYDFQIHIRVYTDGWVSGHYELRGEIHPLEHFDGVKFRLLTQVEIVGIEKLLTEK